MLPIAWLASIAGWGLGGLSVWFYPHPLLQDEQIRMIALLAVPLFTALMVGSAAWVGGLREQLALLVLGALTFAFGISVIRSCFV